MTNEEALQQIHHLIGSRYVPSVKAYIGELIERNQIIGPGELTTTMIDPQRLHIRCDSANHIESFRFG